MGLVISPEERKHLLPKLGKAVIGLGIGLAIFKGGPVTTIPPESMIAFENTLVLPIALEHERHSGYWGKVTLTGGDFRISRLCDLWACQLSRELSELKGGDTVNGLRWGDEIVELRHGNIELLSYSQWSEARISMRSRGLVIGMVLIAVGMLSLILGWWINRRHDDSVDLP